jgi:hypothetical protein
MKPNLLANNLAEAFVRVREKLAYSGPLNFDIISKQNPNYKGNDLVIKFNPPGQLDKTVYVKFL